MRAWILAARPKTLPAALVPVWVGSAPALVGGLAGGGAWGLFAATLASCLAIQIATNLFNDAIDHRKGADTAARLGPRRVTASGMIPARRVLAAGLVCCLFAVAVALPIVLARGWPVVAIGLASLYFAYGYTGGPLPLAYRGLGELFVVLFFGFVAVLGSWFVQSGEWGGAALWIAALQCGLYSSVLIAINNLRDREEDAATGKRTLAVRFGERFAKIEIAAFCLAPAALWAAQAVLIPGAAVPAWTALAASLYIGASLASKVWRAPPGPAYNFYLALGAAQLLIFGLMWTACWIAGARG